MIESRISDRGDDGDVFAILMKSLVEAAGEGDGRSHVMAGID